MQKKLTILQINDTHSYLELHNEMFYEKDKLAFRKAGGYARLQSLIKDFRKYFTVEAGAFGIALCLCLVYAYFTAGVLRRPNASAAARAIR